jgi:hypothetical protein
MPPCRAEPGYGVRADTRPDDGPVGRGGRLRDPPAARPRSDDAEPRSLRGPPQRSGLGRLKTVAAELSDPAFLGLRLHLLTYSIDWPALPTELTTLTTAVANRPLAADLRHTRRTTTESTWTPDSIETALLATTTASTNAGGASSGIGSTGLAEGLLACALVSAAGPRSGWAPPWRELLVALRNHPALDVRQRALDLTTAPEA